MGMSMATGISAGCGQSAVTLAVKGAAKGADGGTAKGAAKAVDGGALFAARPQWGWGVALLNPCQKGARFCPVSHRSGQDLSRIRLNSAVPRAPGKGAPCPRLRIRACLLRRLSRDAGQARKTS